MCMSHLIPTVDLYTYLPFLDVITHTLQYMAAMGRPQIIKTVNGPGYTGMKFQQFCFQFDIKHITGVPYNPQGQGIIE
jgi:transposase InsO family protein